MLPTTLRVAAVCGHAGLGAAGGLVLAWRRKREGAAFDRSLPLAMAIFRLSRQMGGLFPKLAQIVSTRHDLMSEDAIGLLSSACSRLKLTPAHTCGDAWTGRHPGRNIERLGSGAIAEVFLVDAPVLNGFIVKARRPGIDRVLRCDLTVLNALAALAARFGLFRSLNLAANARLLSDLLGQQLDFSAERRNLKAFRANLAGHATVPRVYAPASGERIYMEYVERRIELTAAGPTEGRRLAASVMRLVYRMIFIDGFVHCDLHTGNIYVGKDGQLVVVDAGFCCRIGDEVRLDFREFFLAVGLKRTEMLARIILRYSIGERTRGLERSIRRQCADLVDRHSGLKAGEFRLVSFIRDLYGIYNSHRLSMTSDFFSIIYALLVVEGVVIRLDPDLDFQALAFEFMIENRREIY